MQKDLTKGGVTASMMLFAGPLIAVGSSYSIMVFVTSILLGLSMGSGILFSMFFGAGRTEELRRSACMSFTFIGGLTVVLEVGCLLLLYPILQLMQTPDSILEETASYLRVIFIGMVFTFLYNYFASLLRSVGNSSVPLVFLAVAAVLNIGLDLFLVLVVPMGVAGAALATIFSQGVSGVGLVVYTLVKMPELRPKKENFTWDRNMAGKIAQYSLLTCAQQSVMNFGILMVLRRQCHGGVYSGGENRLLCLYAGAGFRQRFFHLYCPEYGGEKDRPYPPGNPFGGDFGGALLRGDFSGDLGVGRRFDDDFCQPGGNGDYRHRRPVFAH